MNKIPGDGEDEQITLHYFRGEGNATETTTKTDQEEEMSGHTEIYTSVRFLRREDIFESIPTSYFSSLYLSLSYVHTMHKFILHIYLYKRTAQNEGNN